MADSLCRLQVASTLGEAHSVLDLKPLLKYSIQVRSSTLDDPPLWSDWSASHQIKLYGEKSSAATVTDIHVDMIGFINHSRSPDSNLNKRINQFKSVLALIKEEKRKVPQHGHKDCPLSAGGSI